MRRPASASLLFFGLLVLIPGMGLAAEPFPEDSPEHQALTLASPYLGDEAFAIRQDYWRGKVTTRTGRAVKLQFFKGNHYRLFFGAAPIELPPGSRLHLHIYGENNEEVARATGEAGAPAVALEFDNTLGTGIYLVLLRIEAPPGPLAEAEVRSVMFYGWK